MTLRQFDFINGPESDTLPNAGTVESSTILTKGVNYTVLDDDGVGTLIMTGASTTAFLPTAADNNNRRLIIINNSSGDVTIEGEGSESINDALNVILNDTYDLISITCDGTEWFILDICKRPTIQKFTSGSGTYTLPDIVKSIKVRMVGGGGGGGEGGFQSTDHGDAGGTTTFGTSLLSCTGGDGGGGHSDMLPGAGGTASLGSAIGLAIDGGTGGSGEITPTSITLHAGALGGTSFFGGAGGGNRGNNNGFSAKTNSGSGGGGGGSAGGSAGVAASGGGGGAGAYVEALINGPDATYSYAVGAGGAGGADGGSSGGGGGAGAAGIIIVEEFYN